MAALAERAARSAALLLADDDVRRIGVREKASARDLVSHADLAAERVIVDVIQAQRPDDAVAGEELGCVQGTSGLVWGIDPIDGTSNFLAGIPHWATAIGCEDEQGSLVGVIFDPTRDEMFVAARGLGAMLNGIPIHASTCETISAAIAALGPAWGEGWHGYRIDLSDRLLSAVAHGRQMGSLALDLAWTAAGRFDFFYYDSALNPWDVSMRVIAEEAGLVTEVLPPEDDAPGALLASPPALRDAVTRLLGRRKLAS
jgi:myo-inositol-1(or 4)-monophosphatase